MAAKLGFRFSDELIVCFQCKKEWKTSDLNTHGDEEYGEKIWDCPDCNEQLRIYVKQGEYSPVLSRPSISELEEGDIVQLMPSGEYDGLHEIINIEDLYDGTYAVSLQGYRKVILNEDSWINCRVGMWNSDTDGVL
ncbi:hypothetical protein ABE17_12975 [Bacillus mycoides]|uniref:hypothetical protein n=1 Tax=Bacillus cereus group TaxID=86661 RepID=UPI0018CD9B08|nr:MULTISPECIES: hypothetical protein [Bacillus cereus group]MBG9597762.1 hypothetical protein [Bacillus mycoides]MBG9597797.1 hypothetical protein [Bacillus mycoides]